MNLSSLTSKTNNLSNPSDISFLKKVSDKLNEKRNAILLSFPPDYIGYLFMNNFYKGNDFMSACKKITPFSMSLSLVEHCVHRGSKIVGGMAAFEYFEKSNPIVRAAASTALVGSLELCLASPFYRVATQAQVGILKPNNFKNVFSSKYEHFKGASAFALRGVFFTFPQKLSYQACETFYDKRLREMKPAEQIVTIASGVCGGTLGAAIPTWINSVASSKNLSLKESLAYLKTTPSAPFNSRALLVKFIAKVPAHIIQYSTFLNAKN